MKQLAGKVAVITGAASGIGRGLARVCAAEGMRVMCADVDTAAAQTTAAEITAQGGRARAQHCDVRKRAALEELADAAWREFGGCQLLINNAGVMVNKPLLQLEENDWRWVMDVNFYGVVNGTAAFAPRMQQAGGEAHIVNTASVAGLLSIPPGLGLAAYSASKHAVVSYSETLAAELAGTPIGVSVLCPGAVDTRIYESERVRPAELPGTGGADIRTGREAPPEIVSTAQSPEQVAQTVLRAVRENILYIITHPEMQAPLTARHAAIAQAFTDAAAAAANAQ